MSICKNCGAEVSQAYCGACGQKATPDRITFRFFWHEVFHFFTHIHDGFLYTTRELLLAPGPMVVSYIEGKRKVHQSPVSYFLIWVAAFIFALYVLVKLFGENVVIEYGDYFGPGATTGFAISNLSFMLAFIVPVQSIYLWGLITHRRFNYMETIVMATYAVGTIIFLQLIFAILALLQYAVTGRPLLLLYSDLLKLAYFTWFMISLLRTLRLSQPVLRGIAFLLLAGASFTLWRMQVVPGLAGLFMR